MLLQNLDGTCVKKQGRKSRESKEEGHIEKAEEKVPRVQGRGTYKEKAEEKVP